MTDDAEIGLILLLSSIILFILLTIKYGIETIGSIALIFFVIDTCVHTLHNKCCCNSCYECPSYKM